VRLVTARGNASAAAEVCATPIRHRPKHSGVAAAILPSANERRYLMPVFDLYLPPQPYSRWRPQQRREPIHPAAAAVMLIARWIERTRQRKALAALDDHQLRDIGVTRVDAARECGKPFWR